MSNTDDLKQIKSKSIVSLMIERGFTLDTKKSSANYSFFKSPWTNEKTASFAVNIHRNTFFDYSSSFSGDIIALVMQLDKLDFQSAISLLRGKQLSEVQESRKKESLLICNVGTLKSRWLIEYITQVRKIEITIAKKYCKEIVYSIGDHKYWAIGFANDSGGWELRNANWKGGNSPKSVTIFPKTITIPTKELNIFEGFIDYMSALTYYRTTCFKNDTIVLNSCSFKDRIPTGYETYQFFCDADRAGDAVLLSLQGKGKVIDNRHIFTPFNDINEWLQNLSKQF